MLSFTPSVINAPAVLNSLLIVVPLPFFVLWYEAVTRLFQIVSKSPGRVDPDAVGIGFITQALPVLTLAHSQGAERTRSYLEFFATFSSCKTLYLNKNSVGCVRGG